MKQIGQRRARHRDAEALILLREPMQRCRVGTLGHRDVRQKASAVVSALEWAYRRIRGRDELTARARRLLLHVALTHEVARHVLVEVGLLPSAERAICDPSATGALALVVAEVMDHRLAAELLLERSSLATPLERSQTPCLGIFIGLVLAQLLLGRRHLL